MVKPIDSQPCNTHSCFRAENDVFLVTQNETILITKEELTENDNLDNNALSSIIFTYTNVIGGTLIDNNGIIEFTPSVIAGEIASFKYNMKALNGDTTTANVTLNIMEIPETSEYIASTSELDEFKLNFIPPSQADILNTWGRASDISSYYPPGSTPGGESIRWEMISPTQIRSKTNSLNPILLISPKKYNKFTIEVDLSVDDADQTFKDDDQIGIVIGFYLDETTGSFKYLAVVRAANPSYREDGTINHQVACRLSMFTSENSTQQLLAYPSDSSSILVPNKKIGDSLPAWETLAPTRLKIIRTPERVTVYVSPWQSTDISAGTSFTYEFKSKTETEFMSDSLPYGFFANSQYGAMWSNVKFNGGDPNLNYMFDYESKKVYELIDGIWELKPSLKIQDILYYPRTIKSEITGEKFRILKDSITKI